MFGGTFPFTCVLEGDGAYIHGDDDQWYVDWISGLGANLFGYGSYALTKHIVDWLKRGSGFSLPSVLEYQASEKLCKMLSNHVPGWAGEHLQVRWVTSGSDACNAAIRLARAASGKKIVLSCYSRDTDVLTKNGFIAISDITMDHEIATLNRNTNSLEFHKPYTTYKYHHSGNMIHFKGQCIDLLVTPNHMVLAGIGYETITNKEFVFREAVEFIDRITGVPMMQSAEDFIGSQEDIVIPEYPRSEKKLIGEGPVITRFNALTFAKFIGWFVTEGYIQSHNRTIESKQHLIGIRQCNNTNIQKIASIISDMGFEPRIVEGERVYFYSKDLWYWLSQIGKTKFKHIPTQIKNLSKECLIALFEAAIDGDGTRKPETDGARRFYSTSKKLIEDIQEICIKIGLKGTLLEIHNSSGFLSGVGKESLIYHLSISNEVVNSAHAKIEQYDDDVFCVNVPNHVLLVRRNGRCVWSGNSGYHGQMDQFIVMTPPHHGIPHECGAWMQSFTWGDMSSLYKWDGMGLAAVILEQGIVDPDPEYYAKLRKFCDRNHCLLIVDEVVTGLRYGLGGACEKYQIYPDLICMGKGLTAGNALAALVGPKAYLDWFARTDPVFISSTNAGNTAGLAAVDWIIDNFDQSAVAYIERLGARLLTGLNRVGMPTIGHPARSVLDFKDDYQKGYFITRMAQRGIIMNRPNFPTLSHVVSLVERTIAAAAEVVKEMQQLGEEGVRIHIAEEDLPMILFRNR